MAVPPGPEWTLYFSDDFTTNAAYGSFLSTYPNWVAYSAGNDGTGGSWAGGANVQVVSGVLGIKCTSDASGNRVSDVVQRKWPGQSGFTSGHTYYRHEFQFRCASPIAGFHVSILLWPDTNAWTAEIDAPEGDLNSTFNFYNHHENDVHTQDSYVSGIRFDSGWHTFTQEWTANLLKWYVDGTLVKTMTVGIANEAMRGPTFQIQASTTQTAPASSSALFEIKALKVWVPSTSTTAGAVSSIRGVAGTSGVVSRISGQVTNVTPPTPNNGALGPGLTKVEFCMSPALNAWVDASTYLDTVTGVTIRPAGPTDLYDDLSAGQAMFTLRADDGVFWPDNPASPYAGKLIEGLPCRITGTIGTVQSTRHLGRVRLMQPDINDVAPQGAVVQFTTTDDLADLGGLTLPDRLSLNLKRYCDPRFNLNTNGVGSWDVWPLTDDSASTTVASQRPNGNNGTVVAAHSNAGSYTTGSVDGSTVYGPLSLPGMGSFEAASGVGPVLQLPITSTTAGQMYLSWRTTYVGVQTIAEVYDGNNNRLWAIRQALNGGGSGWDVVLTQYDANGNGTEVGRANVGHANDGFWHTAVVYVYTIGATPASPITPVNATQVGMFFDDGSRYFLANADGKYQANRPRVLIVGGGMNPALPGQQTGCMTGDVTMLGTAGFAGIGNQENDCSITPNSAVAEFRNIAQWSIDQIGGYNNSAAPIVVPMASRFAPQGLSALQALQTLAQTVGAQVVVTPPAPGSTAVAAPISFLLATDAPNLTPAWTATLSNDDSATQLPLTRGAQDAPTRVAVSSALGNATYVGDESTRRLDDSLTTFSASATDAYAIGGGWINRPRVTRMTPITIDLATALGGQPLANAVLQAAPMVTTFTLAGLPAALFGVTQQDQLIVTWEETWTRDNTVFSFTVVPAAAWPAGTFSGSPGGSFGAGGVLAAVGGSGLGTGIGTLSVASSSGTLMATGTSKLWNWGGECVAGTASGTSSPQTLTITARGQSGTVARTHMDGDAVDAWSPASWSYG